VDGPTFAQASGVRSAVEEEHATSAKGAASMTARRPDDRIEPPAEM
jgi:hypothetical protein